MMSSCDARVTISGFFVFSFYVKWTCSAAAATFIEPMKKASSATEQQQKVFDRWNTLSADKKQVTAWPEQGYQTFASIVQGQKELLCKELPYLSQRAMHVMQFIRGLTI